MRNDGVMMTVIDRYNARLEAAAGELEPDAHVFASAHQWKLVIGGLDIDYDELTALGEYFADLVTGTMREHPDRSERVIADGLQQMFVLGAMFEQERARRDRSEATS